MRRENSIGMDVELPLPHKDFKKAHSLRNMSVK
jgi:hypothetical protein